MSKNLDLNQKTILITGGAGFIGSNIAIHIQETFPNSKIVIFDCFRNNDTFPNGNLKSYGHYQNLVNYDGEIICGNINNQNDLKLLDKYKFDYIFHHAAISDTRVYDQEIIIKTNANAFGDILNLSQKNRAVLVYASSAATYGSMPSPQTIGKEKPENPYGFSKLIMDQMAQRFILEYPELSIVGLRFFNVYGPREFYKDNTASMVVQLGHQILNGKAPRLFEDSDKIKRDFIYISDVVEANLKACSAKKSGVYNVGTGNPRSFQDIADILQHNLGTSLETEYFTNPFDGYQIDTQADISTSREFLDFHPKISLEDGIKSYIPEIKRLFSEINL